MWTIWRAHHFTSRNYIPVKKNKKKRAEASESFDRVLENVVMACGEFGARFEKNSACSLGGKDEESVSSDGSDGQSSCSCSSE